MEGNTHKYVAEEGSRDLFCRRAPHGARGLKFKPVIRGMINNESRPTRGAWIEILNSAPRSNITFRSRPTRGAWIEMICAAMLSSSPEVAPHTGRVD